MGRHFSCFYVAEDVQAGKPETEFGLAASKGYFQGQGWRVRKDGSRFWANVAMTAIRDRGGSLLGYGVITRELPNGEKTTAGSSATPPAENAVVVVDQEAESSWSMLKLKAFSAIREPICWPFGNALAGDLPPLNAGTPSYFAGSSLYNAPATSAPAIVPIRPKISHTRGTKRPTGLQEACARFPGR